VVQIGLLSADFSQVFDMVGTAMLGTCRQESQTDRSWKGPVEVILSSPLLKQGQLQPVARGCLISLRIKTP